MPSTEAELAGLALALGAEALGPLTSEERALADAASSVAEARAEAARAAILRGEDPLGDAFCRLRTPADRRPMGATYTPQVIVDAMVGWADGRGARRVVDPGAGSGRFLVAAGRRFADAELVAVEVDPLAALILRAHLVTAGLGARSRVAVADYRALALPPIAGTTLFLGNPPYVRHHGIDAAGKAWLGEQARTLGLKASGLAGLHVHFFLATALHARPGDLGALLTSSEWLDVNYGSVVRALFTEHLGGERLHLIAPTAFPFADADTTAVITCFEVGARTPSVHVRRVEALADVAPLTGGRAVPREELAATTRWTTLTRPRPRATPGHVELGELCRVHRGQATGANRVWIAGAYEGELPAAVLVPTVTRAKELFAAAPALTETTALRRVIDLPRDLGRLADDDRAAVERFLAWARARGADHGFVATHRPCWWSVGLRAPAPILATYMARRPPAFVRNPGCARHINIAHGLYPREPLAAEVLDALARHLSAATSTADGRTYAGGLTKFEPKEMERLLVPTPERLLGGA